MKIVNVTRHNARTKAVKEIGRIARCGTIGASDFNKLARAARIINNKVTKDDKKWLRDTK